MSRLIKALLILIVFSLPAFAAEKQLCGGFSPVAADNKDALAAANFAVGEQSKIDNKPIKLVSISQVEKQVVAGLNYKLTLIVEQGALSRTVKAVVFRDLKSKFSLTSWEPL